MLAHRYKVWGWGARSSTGSDEVIKWTAGITCLAKRHRDSPYEVFNELVCMQLGRALGLPIPIGFVLEKDGDLYYCSANLALFDGEAPDADFELFAEKDHRTALGVVVFDAWVANADRHSRNAIYDDIDNQIYIFDHGMALLGNRGTSYLHESRGQLRLCEDLTFEIADASSFSEWYNRVLGIPEFMITDAIRDAAKTGIGLDEQQEVADFLIHRRNELPQLLKDVQESYFPKLNTREMLISPFEDLR